MTISAQQQRIPLVGRDGMITLEWVRFLNGNLIAVDAMASATGDVTALQAQVNALTVATNAALAGLTARVSALEFTLAGVQTQVAQLSLKVGMLTGGNDDILPPIVQQASEDIAPPVVQQSVDCLLQPPLIETRDELVSLWPQRDAEIAALAERIQALEVA